MIIICAMIGTRDLGQEVFIALSKADSGRGIVAGLAIAFIGIIADRLFTAWSAKAQGAGWDRRTDMTATPTVEALLAEWIAAFNAHDLDRHMQLYTEDADPVRLGRRVAEGPRHDQRLFRRASSRRAGQIIPDAAGA